MRRKYLSEESQEYIRKNYNHMTAYEMAQNRKEQVNSVMRFMKDAGLQRYFPSKARRGSDDIKQGFFDEKQFQNWLA